jgi:hypothetical protein
MTFNILRVMFFGVKKLFNRKMIDEFLSKIENKKGWIFSPAI